MKYRAYHKILWLHDFLLGSLDIAYCFFSTVVMVFVARWPKMSSYQTRRCRLKQRAVLALPNLILMAAAF